MGGSAAPTTGTGVTAGVGVCGGRASGVVLSAAGYVEALGLDEEREEEVREELCAALGAWAAAVGEDEAELCVREGVGAAGGLVDREGHPDTDLDPDPDTHTHTHTT